MLDAYGSSPLARGLLRGVRGWAGGTGIIPARAGFTSQCACAKTMAQDHPRSRGVYWRSLTPACPSAGSSPLARGLRHAAGTVSRHRGIIPARAGFTGETQYDFRGHSDHPRSRGVYLVGCSGSAAWLGSSPLARGLPSPCCVPLHRGRIIPARAGFTQGQR